MLRDLCQQYFRANLRIRHQHTRDQYLWSVDAFGAYLMRPPRVTDLTRDNLLGLMHDLADRGKSPATINSRRTYLLALWKFAHRVGRVSEYPDNIGTLPEPRRVPRAWSREQLGQLIDACHRYARPIGGVRGSDWWLAFHGLAWDTAERTGAVLALRWDWYDAGRRVLYVPAECRKAQGKDACYTLGLDTATVLQAVRQQTRAELILPGIGHISGFYRRYETLLKMAGLPTDRQSKPQRIRRSHASHLKAAGGDPTASLMHSSDAVTRRAYLDPSVCGEMPAERLFRIL